MSSELTLLRQLDKERMLDTIGKVQKSKKFVDKTTQKMVKEAIPDITVDELFVEENKKTNLEDENEFLR